MIQADGSQCEYFQPPRQDTDSFGNGGGILCTLERLQTFWSYSVIILNLFEAGYSQLHGVGTLTS